MTALKKIKFRDSDGSNEYTVYVNPSSANLQDGTQSNIRRTLDGAAVLQVSVLDNRERTLVWDAAPTTLSAYDTMITTLKAYNKTKIQIRLEDIDVPIWGWREILVTNVGTNTVSAGSRVRQQVVLNFIFLEPVPTVKAPNFA